jgi:hypothetical protein
MTTLMSAPRMPAPAMTTFLSAALEEVAAPLAPLRVALADLDAEPLLCEEAEWEAEDSPDEADAVEEAALEVEAAAARVEV